MTNSSKVKNVLSNHIINSLNQQEVMNMVKKGFKGYDNMELGEVTDIFVDKFGWAKYGEIVGEFSKNQRYIGYFDASHISQTGEGYIAYVIKTEDNQLVIRDAFKVNIKDIFVGESMALLRLLTKALELGIDNLDVYGDNKSVIDRVNRRKGGVKGWNGFFPSIVNKMDKFTSVNVIWNNRDGNKYADMLCRLKRRGADISKRGGKFDLRELHRISAKVG